MLLSKQNYVDVPFFITKNPFTGDINLTKDMNAIKSCMKNLILTNIGERPFNATFGTKVQGSMFIDTENFLEKFSLIASITKTLYGNDNRLETVNVNIIKVNNAIQVLVNFKLKNTNTSETIQLDIF